MLRPPTRLAKLLTRFVCVRVTDMSQIDLDVFQFDYDLTFALLTMRTDGTVYHRFGSRNHKGPMEWISLEALYPVLDGSLREHEAAGEAPKRTSALKKPSDRRTIWELPVFKKRMGKRKPACIHCHSVFPALHAEEQAAQHWDQATDVWVYPEPRQVGLELHPVQQQLITAILPKSPAAVGGLQTGDRLVSAAGARILSIADFQSVLHGLPGGATRLAVTVQRGAKRVPVELSLQQNWKIGSPLGFSWRPSKWDLTPAPGFGGRFLNSSQRQELGLQDYPMALEVTYLVTWGHRGHTGRHAVERGLRKGDVVTAIGGRSDFANPDHVHAWFRLTRKVGDTVELQVVRGDETKVIQITLQE